MREHLSPTTRRLGVASGISVASLCLAYAIVLSVGLLTLPSSSQQIQEPWFTLMELLIIAISPAMVLLSVAQHASANQEHKPLTLASTLFMSMSAAVTCSVHFAILTLSTESAFSDEAWVRLVFSFKWPSVAYAFDILAWDFFFPLSALFAATAVQGAGIAGSTRKLLFASAALAFAGLVGVPLSNMQIRNIGIIGYAVLFPIASALLAVQFRRASSTGAA
jgi:hypothetical protein